MSRRVKRPLKAKGDRPKGARSYRDQPVKRPSEHRLGGKPPRFAEKRDERPDRRKEFAPEPAMEKAEPPLPTKVQTVVVTADEDNMRVDRFLEAHFPGLSFSHIQRIVRKGELRVNGKRADSKDRLQAGQSIRIPPLRLDAPKSPSKLSEAEEKTLVALKAMILYEDDDVAGAEQAGGACGAGRLRHHAACRPDAGGDARRQGAKAAAGAPARQGTSGCLLVAKTRFAASQLTGAFRHRSARKVYWALVAGVPKPKQGRISTYLAKEESEDDSIMRIAAHGDEGASHAVTYYAVVETSATKLAWVSLKPVHRANASIARAYGAYRSRHRRRSQYFNKENWSCRAVCRTGCICSRGASSSRIRAAA